jgi:glycosyltransferase involved in cell wall biosynthesis
MNVSVVIPTYNSARTIQATLDSVLQQTVPPDEILILDDGSTDNTLSILDSYKSSVIIFQQKNKGVASARNFLCKQARGDLIAFLDHDDIWHPKYLEVQRGLYESFPNAVAYFTEHVNFYGYSNYDWSSCLLDPQPTVELITPRSFFKRYYEATGPFASMSYCCVPKWVLKKIGRESFCVKVSGVDDSYFFGLLTLLGSVVYIPLPLVAYRITSEAQSANRLKSLALWVEMFQLLEERYRKVDDTELFRVFKMAFASKRRQYGKTLMGIGETSEARRQFWYSLNNSSNLVSIVKSLSLLFLSFMPALLQPKWPSSYRK